MESSYDVDPDKAPTQRKDGASDSKGKAGPKGGNYQEQLASLSPSGAGYAADAEALSPCVTEGHVADTPATHFVAAQTAGAVQKKPKDSVQKEEGIIDATDEALGQSNVDQMNEVHRPNPEIEGVFYAHNYAAKLKREGKEMDKAWWKGHAPEGHFDTSGYYKFRLKEGKSAADAIEAFFAGPTICECFSIMVAMQYRTILRAVGKEKFDAEFGKDGEKKDMRLFVEMGMSYNNPLRNFRKQTEAAQKGEGGSSGKRPAKKGEWYYVYNHPHYLLKHPAGAYQGENCFCMGENSEGEQIWRGFGVGNVTEEEMLQEMARAYNTLRTTRDADAVASGGPADLYDWTKGHFKETIEWTDILKAPAYGYGGTTRKGGFVVGAGVTLDAEEVKTLKDGS
jgi:hypothetical protein